MLCIGSPFARAPWELGQLIPWAQVWRSCSWKSSRAGDSSLAQALWQLAYRRVLAAAVQACSSELGAPPKLLKLLRVCVSAVIT